MMIDKDYLLEVITEDAILSIMEESFSVTPYKITNKVITFSTVCHCGDSHKLYYYRDTKMFYCYTNCGQMDIIGLTMKVMSCSFYDALKFLSAKLGINQRKGFGSRREGVNFKHEDNGLSSDYLSRRERNKPQEEIYVPKPISDNILNYFEHNVFYGGWMDEGISISSMEKFNICWYELNQSVIIPHYNIQGELIGIRRRSFLESDILAKRKYMPLIVEKVMYEHPLGLNLYGLHEHLTGIRKHKRIVITESEKSVLLSDTYYGEDSCAVATCGFNITNAQRDMILSIDGGIEEVILAFDKDYDPLECDELPDNAPQYQAYTRFVKRIESFAYKFTNFCRVSVLWDTYGILNLKDSPYDRGKENFEKLMSNRIELTTKEE